MIKAQIVTSWTSKRTYDLKRLCQKGDSIIDACGTPPENIPPDPNVVIVECWLSAKSYNAILAHPDYGEASILWSEVM